jgi:signal peptidase II
MESMTNVADHRVRTTPMGGMRFAVWGVAVGVLLADQVSKSLVLAVDPGSATRWGAGWFSVRLVRNTGASFGIGAGHPLVITLVALVLTVVVAVLTVLAARSRGRVAAIAWAVVLGGAAGNLADRLIRAPGLGRGAVVDWIHVDGYPATFNLADLALRAGVVVAVITMILAGRSSSSGSQRSQ